MKTSDSRAKLLTENPIPLMISLCVPAVIGMLVVGLYSFMDGVFVGQMVSTAAVGAVSVSYPFTLINNGLAIMVGVGSASVLSRAIGKKDQNTVDKIMGNLIMMIAVCSLVITVIGTVFTRPILLLSGASGEKLELAVKYLRIVYVGSMFVNFSQSANMVMRGEGLLKRAMIIMGIGAVLNIILDPIMIQFLSPYEMGIEAAAYATVISQFVQAAITLWYFMKKSRNVRIHKVRLDRELFPEIVGVGISAMLMQVTTLLQQTVLYNVAANYGGDTWQTLLGVALRIQSFAFIPVWGISQGFQPVAGTNYGAKQYDRVRTLCKVFMIGATLVSLLFYIPIELAPKAVLSLFITDPSIVEQGVVNFRIFFSSYILQGSMIVVITLLQALGRAKQAGTMSLLRQIILFIPCVMLLPKVAGMGIRGVWAAPALVDAIIFIICMGIAVAEFRRMSMLKKEAV